ncbi:hypothetical protein CBR_g32337 [Chara braunii]|uniref:Uncharacterized protein n=1 Tax=Chara braunii TaxID=69332 RepID=A0A388JNH6_CHABU|nr:hypothetical protein CBR_g32337 [Chara braunii]|eukprot:GBG59325.1 hypothetical protein CBR_g32337 [Chara braunii]
MASAARQEPAALACAQFCLAQAYEKGRGVTKDTRKAAELYLMAADEGHYGAMHNAARCYATGKGLVKDQTEAVIRYAVAASDGNPASQFALAEMYASERNQKAAEETYRAAAEQGHPEAQLRLADLIGLGHLEDSRAWLEGRIFRTQGPDFALEHRAFLNWISRWKVQSQKEYEEVTTLLHKSAVQGNAEAYDKLQEIKIFWLEERSFNMEETTAVAMSVCKELHASGHLEQYQRGWKALLGINVVQDPSTAFKCFHRLSRKQHAHELSRGWIQFVLGLCYLEGQGTKQDVEKAKKYLKLALNANIMIARDAWSDHKQRACQKNAAAADNSVAGGQFNGSIQQRENGSTHRSARAPPDVPVAQRNYAQTGCQDVLLRNDPSGDESTTTSSKIEGLVCARRMVKSKDAGKSRSIRGGTLQDAIQRFQDPIAVEDSMLGLPVIYLLEHCKGVPSLAKYKSLIERVIAYKVDRSDREILKKVVGGNRLFLEFFSYFQQVFLKVITEAKIMTGRVTGGRARAEMSNTTAIWKMSFRNGCGPNGMSGATTTHRNSGKSAIESWTVQAAEQLSNLAGMCPMFHQVLVEVALVLIICRKENIVAIHGRALEGKIAQTNPSFGLNNKNTKLLPNNMNPLIKELVLYHVRSILQAVADGRFSQGSSGSDWDGSFLQFKLVRELVNVAFGETGEDWHQTQSRMGTHGHVEVGNSDEIVVVEEEEEEEEKKGRKEKGSCNVNVLSVESREQAVVKERSTAGVKSPTAQVTLWHRVGAKSARTTTTVLGAQGREENGKEKEIVAVEEEEEEEEPPIALPILQQRVDAKAASTTQTILGEWRIVNKRWMASLKHPMAPITLQHSADEIAARTRKRLLEGRGWEDDDNVWEIVATEEGDQERKSGRGKGNILNIIDVGSRGRGLLNNRLTTSLKSPMAPMTLQHSVDMNTASLAGTLWSWSAYATRGESICTHCGRPASTSMPSVAPGAHRHSLREGPSRHRTPVLAASRARPATSLKRQDKRHTKPTTGASRLPVASARNHLCKLEKDIVPAASGEHSWGQQITPAPATGEWHMDRESPAIQWAVCLDEDCGSDCCSRSPVDDNTELELSGTNGIASRSLRVSRNRPSVYSMCDASHNCEVSHEPRKTGRSSHALAPELKELPCFSKHHQADHQYRRARDHRH